MPAENTGLDRRTFLKRAAVTGAVVWSVPLIETIGASPAFATSAVECGKSFGPSYENGKVISDQGCMGACQAAVHAMAGVAAANPGFEPGGNPDPPSACNSLCNAYCPNVGGHGGHVNRLCCDPGLCHEENFRVVSLGGNQVKVCYMGPTGGTFACTVSTNCYSGNQ